MGISIVYFLVDLQFSGGMAVLVLTSSVALLSVNFRRHAVRRAFFLLLAFSFGVLWHVVWAKYLLEKRLPDELEGIDLLTRGYVLDIPSRNGLAQQFRYRILESDPEFNNRTVLVNYYGEQTVEPDQSWQLLLRLNKAHGFYNPGGNDYEAWLFQRRIAAKGYVRLNEDNRLLSSKEGILSLNRIRAILKNKIVAAMSGSANTGAVLALSLGDRSMIDASAWDLYGKTGTTHLFVVSGLHIGLIAGFAYSLTSLLLRIIPSLCLFCARQKIAAGGALCFSAIYSLLAGFTMPTQRALIMLSVFMLSYLFNRNSPMSFRYMLSMAVVLSINPMSALNGGFWFSFLAVGVLLLRGGAKSNERVPLKLNSESGGAEDSMLPFLLGKAASMVRPQMFVFLALILPLLFFTSRISLISPLVNIIAIPVLGLLIVPLCLISMTLLLTLPDIGKLLYKVLGNLLDLFGVFLDTLLSICPSWSVIEIYKVLPAVFSSGILLVLLGIIPKGILSRRFLIPLLAALLLPFAIPKPLASFSDGLDIHILDVGQGLSVLIRTQNHSLLFDTGARLSETFDLGEAVVAPALTALGVNHLDSIVVSHADNDHSGGLEGVLFRFPSAQLLTNKPSRYSVSSKPCRKGNKWSWDNVEFEFLHPDSQGLVQKENNNSCVLKVSIGKFALLLPGDIEASIERQLSRSSSADLSSTVLVAAHHGSQTSSTYPFLKKAEPRYVVYSAGYRNSFSHPHINVQSRFQEFGSEASNTANSGMISFSVSEFGDITSISSYRDEKPRYWH